MTSAAATTAMSTAIPTGAFISTDYSKFFQNYWWLRSPSMDRGGYAYYVDQSGVVYYYFNSYYNGYVTSSYGRRSPGTSYDYVAWYVRPSGDVDGNRATVSYGRRSPDAFMYYNYTSFYVMEDGSMITYAVEYSYGIF